MLMDTPLSSSLLAMVVVSSIAGVSSSFAQAVVTMGIGSLSSMEPFVGSFS